MDFNAGSASKAEIDEYDAEVGRRLSEARRFAGLTIAEAADALGMSQQSLYKYEQGTRTLKAKLIYDAAMLYEANVGWLLCMTDTMWVRR